MHPKTLTPPKKKKKTQKVRTNKKVKVKVKRKRKPNETNPQQTSKQPKKYASLRKTKVP
jgi:hypothetical protein